MRKRKIFVLTEELLGETINMRGMDTTSICLKAAFESIETGADLCAYLVQRRNKRKIKENLDEEANAQIENNTLSNQIEIQELKQNLKTYKEEIKENNNNYKAVWNTIMKVSQQLNQVIDFVKAEKKELSATEELIKSNKKLISEIDEWLRTSTKNYINIMDKYQTGG
ncbi:MAG: hypothetical protein Q4E24_03495 [bacterium]|nr:hypothetical protein [bacterium]